MKKAFVTTFLFALVFLFTAPAHSTSGNLNLFIGQKSMDDSDYWDEVDDHTELGIIFDMIEGGWPVSLELGLLMSSDSADYREGKTSELSVGIKKIWTIRNFPLKPFISGGLDFISAEDDIDGWGSEEDSAMGFYFSLGAYATLSRQLNLGLMFRMSKADVDLHESGVGAGGQHIGFLIGYHF